MSSIDGYGAGPNQDLQNPLGVNGPEVMEWFFHTRVWRRMHGHVDGESGIDNDIAELGFTGIGAMNGIDMRSLGYECAKYIAGERATHIFLRKRTAADE